MCPTSNREAARDRSRSTAAVVGMMMMMMVVVVVVHWRQRASVEKLLCHSYGFRWLKRQPVESDICVTKEL